MDFTIRQATIDDLNSIVDMWQKLSVDQMSKDPYYKGSLTFTGGEKQFTNALNDPNCCIFVAEVSEKVIGFIEVWLYNKDFHFFADDYAYILHYYVDSDSRREKSIIGIVYQLFKASEAWAISKGRKYLVADVFSHNQRVEKLLEFVGLNVYRSRLVKELNTESSGGE